MAVLLVLTAALVVLGAHAFSQKLASFQPLGFLPTSVSSQWVVRSVATPAPGDLQAGDRIVLVNGIETGRISDLRRLLAASPETQLVVLRDDQLETVRYLRPPLAIDYAWLTLAALGLLYLAIGLYTLWRSEKAVLFYCWSLASAVLYTFSPVFPVDATGTWVYLADEIARLLLPPLTLHLFLAIPQSGERRRPLRALLYLPAALMSLVQVDLARFGGTILVGHPTRLLLRWTDRIELLLLAAYAATAILVLARRLVRIHDWERHRQLLWLLVGMTAGYAPFVLLYSLPYVAGIRLGQPLAVVAVAPLACVPLAFGWAVLRYRLWDLGLMVRNGIAHGLTLLAGVGGFALLDLVLRRSVPEHLSFARDLLTFFGGAAIVGMVIPTHRRIQGALERMQYGRGLGRRRQLARLGQELLRERDLDRLCEILLEELEYGLELEKANLLLVQGNDLLAVRPELAIPGALPADALRTSSWHGRFEVLTGVALPGQSGSAEQRLYAGGYRYIFPLVVRQARIGIVLAGLKRGGQPLDSEDVDLVRVLLDQAALAIENAQLLEQVHRQLEQVSTLQRHNEGILESTPAGIALLEDDVVSSANLAFAALVGRPRPETLGRALGDLLDLGELPAPGADAKQVACEDALGRVRHLEVGVAPLQGPQTGDRRVLVLQDVTNRVEMESALKEKDRLASLGVLAAGVAHEINTPLTGISSYAQLLLSETDSADPRRELLEKVERQTFRASRIVSNLLEFARKPGRERQRVDLGPLLSETVELLRERLSQKGVRLHWSEPEDPVEVVGSDGELQQVVTNLMLNAIDAMTPQGGGHLGLELSSRPGWAEIRVSDDGPGVPPVLQEAILQPFFTTKRGQGGTGLGLSITYSIVQQHGGRLSFTNLEPHGCCFVVELPLSTPTPTPAG